MAPDMEELEQEYRRHRGTWLEPGWPKERKHKKHKEKRSVGPYIDLHTHTIYSDGEDYPEMLIRHAALRGVDELAVTDHDTTVAYDECKRWGERFGIKVIPGVEVTTKHYHILGLGVNPRDEGLKMLLSRSLSCRVQKVQRYVDTLREEGIPITREKIDVAFPASPVGRWKLVLAMMQDAECRAHLKSINSTAYRTLHERVKEIDDSMLKGPYVGVQETIDAIHGAGGIAIVAHPFVKLTDPSDLSELVGLGLDGLEVQPHFGEKNLPFIEYAREHKLIITCGSDYHGWTQPTRTLLGRDMEDKVNALLAAPRQNLRLLADIYSS
jgi:hypothetical protein